MKNKILSILIQTVDIRQDIEAFEHIFDYFRLLKEISARNAYTIMKLHLLYHYTPITYQK